MALCQEQDRLGSLPSAPWSSGIQQRGWGTSEWQLKADQWDPDQAPEHRSQHTGFWPMGICPTACHPMWICWVANSSNISNLESA